MNADEPDQDAIQWEEARRWFVRADDDLAAVRATLDAEPPIVRAAAFHCQQAAEKLLKGLLIAARLTALKTHDLTRLTPGVVAAFPEVEELVSALRPLSPWYVIARYPDVDEAEPGPAAIEAAFDMASALRRRVRELDPFAR